MNPIDPSKLAQPNPATPGAPPLLPTPHYVEDKKHLAELSERVLCAMLQGRLETQTHINAAEWARASVELAACLILELGQ